MADNLNQNIGLFVNTTFTLDVAELQRIEVTSPEFKELLVRLYENLNSMVLALNIKDSAYYNTSEFVNGQLLFPNPANNSTTASAPDFRQIYRKVINFGALPNTATKSVAHGITMSAATTFTRIYAAASDTTGMTYIPIPYASVAGTNVELSVDATNVNITTGANLTNYNICYVILEYVQQ